MPQKKILFRADGDAVSGLGHMYRLFALIEVLKNQYEYLLLVKEGSVTSIIPEDYNFELIPKEVPITKEPEWLANRYTPEEHILIADGYHFDVVYQKKLRQLDFFFVYIDDSIEEGVTAHIIINHSENIEPADYRLSNVDTFALGAKYAILRPTFLKACREETKQVNQVSKVFVCFGGADPLNLSLKAVRGLLQIKEINHIHVVVGGAYQHSEIYLLATHEKSLHIHQNIDEGTLYQLMKECDFAIAPASTILYELCTTRTPVLSGYFVPNQKNIYASMAKKDVVYAGGDFSLYEEQDFTKEVKDILKSNSFEDYQKRQEEVFDGNSGNRLLSILNTSFCSLRNINENDLKKTYDISNDELVRKNSFHSDRIPFDVHEKWFFTKLKDKKTTYLMGQFFNEDAAVIRIEKQENFAIVGISLIEKFRGKGLAPSFLIKSAKYYFKQNALPILAYIKNENIPSIKSFERAGYKFYKEDTIRGIPSVIYKLTSDDVFG